MPIWLICLLAVIAAVMLTVLFFPVKVSACYAYSYLQKKNIYVISVFGKDVINTSEKKKRDRKVLKGKKNDKSDKSELFGETSFEGVKRIVQNERIKNHFYSAFRNLKKIADVRYAECSLDFGLDDAALTGVASGIIYGAVYDVFAKLYYFFKIKKDDMNIRVVPHFDGKCMEIYLEIKVCVRLVFAVFAVMDFWKIYKDVKKEMSKV